MPDGYFTLQQLATTYGNNPAFSKTLLKLDAAAQAGEISFADFSSTVYSFTGKTVEPWYYADGTLGGYKYLNTVSTTPVNNFNSNAATTSRATLTSPVQTSTDTVTGKIKPGAVQGVGSRAATAFGMIGAGIAAVGVGMQLGLNIDRAFYTVGTQVFENPAFEAFNTESFEKIIIDSANSGDIGGKLLAAMFGIDPTTGETQMYIKDDAFAYMSAYLQSLGLFATGKECVSYDTSLFTTVYPTPITFSASNVDYYRKVTSSGTRLYHRVLVSNVDKFYYVTSSNTISIILFSLSPFSYDIYSDDVLINTFQSSSTTVNNKTFYFGSYGDSLIQSHTGPYYYPNFNPTQQQNREIAYCCLFGDIVSGAPEGVTPQQGATIPSDLTTNPTTNDGLLRQQYPDLYNNAINYPVVEPDGTIRNDTYIPVAIPQAKNWTDTQPTTGNTGQTQPYVDPSTATQAEIDFLTQVLQQPSIQPATDTEPPKLKENNPADIGEGSTPVAVAPTGTASSLWAIYHPTQAQIDSFGAWLWSSNFIDQILKIFNNPMEAIIGLHKIYATPIDAGTTTIKVGYLDSNVSSAYITEQYVTVSCGSITLEEQFGNVFDYDPYTNVQLYLPFIGIVPLDVSEIMRSTITVDYGVDVITGACLATVEISRDGNDAVLYQYSGNCAVQYPISSGSYMGIVSGILGVAGSVAATVASGGSVAPLAIGAATSALSAHTSVQHSGSFSGNAGAMGCKKPYLIINRPQTKIADNFEEMQGVTTNAYVTVGECTGYIKADVIHILNVNATDTELDMINSYFRNGVII